MLVEFIYGIFFVLALLSGLMVVLTPHAVYSALYLVVTMVSIAGLFVLMNAQLAAFFQIIVYAGAIMVLFLFVVMLLNVGRQVDPPGRTRMLRNLGLVLSLAFVVQLLAMMISIELPEAYSLANAEGIGIHEVARRLLTDYLYAFEMVSILLLVAVVGAVVLARRWLIQGTVHETIPNKQGEA